MNEAQNEEQAAPAPETQPVAERHLPEILTQLGDKALDGAVSGAAAYVVKKGLDKMFGHRGPGDGGGQDSGPATTPPESE